MNRSVFIKFLLSLAVGLSFAQMFAIQYLDAEKYVALDKLALFAAPAFALTIIAYFYFSFAEEKIRQVSRFTRLATFGLALLAASVFVFSTNVAPISFLIASLIFLTAFFFALIFPATPFIQNYPRLLISWALASCANFFIAAFFSNFYIELYQVALTAFVLQLALGVFVYFVIGEIQRFAQKRGAIDLGVVLAEFAVPLVFQAIIFKAGLSFPNLFRSEIFLLEGKQVVLFFVAIILAFAWLVRILSALNFHALSKNKLVAFIRENIAGILLATAFLGLYLLIGSVLNHPRFDVDDIFFDSDGFIWRYRVTSADQWRDFYWRSVHPLALLILRPTVFLISFFLNGNLHFAAILLTATAGAACIFFAWLFLKEALRDSISALIMATLLGISTAHLIFGSLIETYIFLAALILFFFVLIQRGVQSPPLLISIGVATMGITLTNIAQIAIALFGAKRDFKFLVKYGITVVALTVSLTLFSNLIYPNAAPYFFVPSSFQAERQNVRAVSFNRASALARAFLFNNIVAPEPMTAQKDIPFTQFRFYRAEDGKISDYASPLQSATAKIWLAFLALAAIFFVKDFKSQNIGLTLALVGCVAFNLAVHLRYGKELFLYSPNWTYAVVLLFGLSWKNLLAQKWFKILLVVFLFLLTFNNAALLETIMKVSAPYIK